MTLINEKDFKPSFWSIEIAGIHPSYLQVKQAGEHSGSDGGTLLFKDYQSAKDFWDWLSNFPAILNVEELEIQKWQLLIFLPIRANIESVRKNLLVTLFE